MTDYQPFTHSMYSPLPPNLISLSLCSHRQNSSQHFPRGCSRVIILNLAQRVSHFFLRRICQFFSSPMPLSSFSEELKLIKAAATWKQRKTLWTPLRFSSLFFAGIQVLKEIKSDCLLITVNPLVRGNYSKMQDKTTPPPLPSEFFIIGNGHSLELQKVSTINLSKNVSSQ